MRTANTFKNIFTRFFASLSITLLGFIFTPYLLRTLGSEKYALFKLTHDWVACFSFLETALINSVLSIFSRAKEEGKEYWTILAFKRFFQFSYVTFLLTLCLLPFLSHFMQIPILMKEDIYLAFIIGSLGYFLLPFSAIRIWLDYHERQYEVNYARLTQAFLANTLAIIAAYIHPSISMQMVALVLANLSLNLMLFYYFKKHNGHLNIHDTNKHDDDNFKQSLKKSIPLSLSTAVCSKISFATDSLILGFFVPPHALTQFLLTIKLPVLLQENLQSIGNSSWGGLAQLIRQENWQEFKLELTFLNKLVAFIALSVAIPIFFLNESFINLWVGKEYFGGKLLMSLALFNAYLMAFFSLWGWCLSGSGHIKTQIPLYLGNTVINLIFSLVGVKYLKLSGPLLGTLSGYLLVYLWYIPSKMDELFKVPRMTLIKSLFLPLIMAMPLFFLGFWLISTLHSSLFHFILEASLVFLVSSIYFFVVILDKWEKEKLLNSLKHFIQKKRGQNPN